MRLLVVGAGSTGGYFGGRLAQAGRDVTFLVRPARAAQLRERGLEIRSPHGDVTLHPQLVTAAELAQPYDAILLTVKGYTLDAAMEDFAPAVGADTVILPVLNGMRHVDRLKARFGAAAVGGGLCKCATTLDDEGRIVQLSGMQELAYGELDGRPSPRMQALDAFMAKAGFDARLSPIIEGEMWEKWLLLSSLGAITCLMRGTTGEVEAAPGGRDFILDVIDEAMTVISAVGVPPRQATVEAVRGLLTTKGSPMTSSMYRDLEGGHRVEAEEIVGDLVRRGREAGIATPLLAAANTHLGVYANRARG
ncbi:2-dehydropantoate 2-reductase [Azospirillum picis]|uniref:2-dehydropantoate 2-reductase n=1 Tax=Azospirillum picis TaxID=488438 RepID=A0ABU0MNB0_9PROT|nr:2-dehydropantoate 2-reductase [Azospirillum picis]MBP2303544.1 2-dehydropantoate 2-reductase [Azospirillum picis]MDQ0534950.1 2-dehydropantoate 2-reductase [Azospirillum picis]